jgi:hypothetical protein
VPGDIDLPARQRLPELHSIGTAVGLQVLVRPPLQGDYTFACIAPLPSTWAGLALFDCADPKGLLTSWRLSTFDGILAKKGTTNLVPVVNVDDPVFNDIKRSNRLKSAPHGIALRFRIGHAIGLSAAGLDKKVSDAKALGWPVRYVVIDLMTTPEVDDPDVKTLGAAASGLAGKGYVVHIVSGSYPNGYKNLNVGLNEVDRRDWHLFERLQKTISDPHVGYGDYTVVGHLQRYVLGRARIFCVEHAS